MTDTHAALSGRGETWEGRDMRYTVRRDTLSCCGLLLSSHATLGDALAAARLLPLSDEVTYIQDETTGRPPTSAEMRAVDPTIPVLFGGRKCGKTT